MNWLLSSVSLLILSGSLRAQDLAGRTRVIQPCACQVKVDSTFKTRCAYLIVPENRMKRNSKTIKVPFIIVESKNPNKSKDPLLFTAGGPGGSSLGWAEGAARHSLINDRDCIAFEQRGTHFAKPELAGSALSDAIVESYRKNLNKDSMVIVGTKKYKKDLEAQGIDLAGYNTDETVADIEDLLISLQIDSVNLYGGSYSGGLMLAVLQKDPTRIRSLILDSPLPTFIPIDEDEPANFNEALSILFEHVEKDSAGRQRYGDLKNRFQRYFNSIDGKIFMIPYYDESTRDTLHIQYTRNDLLDVIENSISDAFGIKDVPHIIVDLIEGIHYPYIKSQLDGLFRYGRGPSGMRISVYCADQTAYHDEGIINNSYNAYPYMRGYHINDVYRAMCDCWNVPPVKPETKQPFYSNVPALLADGEMDMACRPVYMDLIHHYMPNSKRVLSTDRSHMVGTKELEAIMKDFLRNPYGRLSTDQQSLILY